MTNSNTLDDLLVDQAEKSTNAKRWKEELNPLNLSAYQLDVSKIIYSDPFRRLSNKTQVFMSRDLDQHSRTRLTHTLEVAQTSKLLARNLGLNSDLAEAIALGHDLGHTPFGHAGESVLNKKLEAVGKSFNHNVQSVWLAQKLDYNLRDKNGSKYLGLNLSYKVLEGIWKHTKIKDQLNEYEDGLKFLSPDTNGPLEAQIVNISDSISYIYHDINDAVRNKIITLNDFKSDVWSKLFDFEFDPTHWQQNFLDDIIKNSHELDEIKFSDEYKNAYKKIRDYLYEVVIKSEVVNKYDQECMEKIDVIYDYYINNVDSLMNKYKLNNKYKLDNYGPERVVVDYIQWLGDANANMEYEKITKGKK